MHSKCLAQLENVAISFGKSQNQPARRTPYHNSRGTHESRSQESLTYIGEDRWLNGHTYSGIEAYIKHYIVGRGVCHHPPFDPSFVPKYRDKMFSYERYQEIMNSALEFCFGLLSILYASGGIQIFLILQALDFVVSNKFVTTY